MDFPGTALVIGAASVVADVNHDALVLVKKEIESTYKDVRVAAIQVDVRDEASVKQLVDGAVAAFGRIDYCANVAGIIRFGDTSVLPVDDWDLVQQINLRGTFLCAKYQIKAMLKQEPLTSSDSPFPARGVIVNVASQAGLMGNPNLPAYVASKHGVIGLSKSDGLKFGKEGIRVNALCPGTIQTPMLGTLPQGEAGRAREAERKHEIALGRVGEPEEIANCILFLTSGRSSFITATTLAAHGGLQ
ncbi:hypothetical protein LTR13_009201 [Exophiala sideris]|uniref:NAD(P)-binding protein n=1 Tax=Exophiala sideris TaxID=1016849 RepID=A0ABR0J061_9EURO|nr:hypothetical protein LTR13_009201 [Exophiala sideris]KAK5052871.1 hypothetical protein LTR69_009697 [Exophiala sideris]KAK5178482.1 hypothetical protein LTR44_009107 [Eurotiomycetes sp. CCFEE 6388]